MLRFAVIAALSLAALYAQEEGLGRIDFPTTESGPAQRSFIRGVLFLHSFQYRESRAEFRAAQKASPNFVMAYWGEAMTYNEPLWFAQDADAARAVLKRLQLRRTKAPTEREAAYLNAVRILYGDGRKEERDFEYASAMQRLHERYPKDDEAAAFYALALLGTSHRGRDYRTYMKAAAIAEDILARNPEHPGALHYAIHCYDDPVHAPLGLRAARVYAKVAPEASHALHMPSHIFFAMGMWAEAARSNEAAFRASQKSAAAGQEMEAGGYHALWWLQYAYLQQGRIADARRILGTMEKLASQHRSPLARFHLVQMRSMFSIETGEPLALKDDVAGLDLPAAGAYYLAAGLAALNHGQRQQAENALQALKSLKSASPSSVGGTHHMDHAFPGDKQVVSVMENQLAASLLLADGKTAEAMDLMKQAVAIEDKTPYEFGPPSSPKPAHELLGDMLLGLHQPQRARVQFELALLRAPGRALSRLGLARSFEQLGDRRAARDAYSDLRKMWTGGDEVLRKAVDDSLAKLQGAPTNPGTP